jgi:hypothetical protein
MHTSCETGTNSNVEYQQLSPLLILVHERWSTAEPNLRQGVDPLLELVSVVRHFTAILTASFLRH